MGLPGTIVRQAGDLVVEQVPIPEDLRASGDTDEVWRVTVRGSYPPRDLRYEVSVDGRWIGYGTPTPRGNAVRTLTTDESVLTGTVTVNPGPLSLPASKGTDVTEPQEPQRHYSAARLPGPLAVTREAYDFGPTAFQPSAVGRKVDITADVHYPTGLPGGPYPLVVFMHGNHVTCYKDNKVAYRWPCAPGWTSLPNYEGYDYISRRLASWGFIVVSISANGVNVVGNRVEDSGMRQRGEVLERHLDLWNAWNSVGGTPFGIQFVGKVDMSEIGTMGHSRGGEGVVWNVIVDRERPVPYGIDAVLSLAPVDFTRVPINNVPFAVMLPYCDGDVSDLQGIHFFDDSRYLDPLDPTPKHTVTVMGAGHNLFNTVWTPGGLYPGGWDDSDTRSCQGKLEPMQVRSVGAAYIVSYFRRYLTDTTSLDAIWTGAEKPSEIPWAASYVSYLAPPSMREDLDRFTSPSGLGINDQGGAVTADGFSRFGWCADTFMSPCLGQDYQWNDVHLGGWNGEPGLGQGQLGWDSDTAAMLLDLPPGSRDVSGFQALQFRAAADPGFQENRGITNQDLSVVLVDGSGGTAVVLASDIGADALVDPWEVRGHSRYIKHFILNQVRFPLSSFAGVDLTDVRSVELRFDRTRSGVVSVADLAFTRGAP